MITNEVNYVERKTAGDWADQAACKGMAAVIFFPDRGRPGRTYSHEAIKVCDECEVQKECLEYANDNGERFGVWGGLSTRQRQVQRQRTRKNGGG